MTRGFARAPVTSPVQPCAVTNTRAGMLAPASCGIALDGPSPRPMVTAAASGSSIEFSVTRIAVARRSGSMRTSTMSAALRASRSGSSG